MQFLQIYQKKLQKENKKLTQTFETAKLENAK